MRISKNSFLKAYFFFNFLQFNYLEYSTCYINYSTTYEIFKVGDVFKRVFLSLLILLVNKTT